MLQLLRIRAKRILPSKLFKPVHGYLPLGMVSNEPYIFFSSYSGLGKRPFNFLYFLAILLVHRRVTWIFICTWHMNDSSSAKCLRDIKSFTKKFIELPI
jgi:hypothetical protein